MDVLAAISPTATETQAKKRTSDQHLQDLFATVLAEAGREGYASAQPADLGEDAANELTSGWQAWFDGVRNQRYQSTDDAQQLREGYGRIVTRAYQEGGFVDPKAFLSQLDTGELATLQRVNSLADPIRVDGLSEEGSLNLLLPPAAQVDQDFDGLTQTGISHGIRFPDSRTPPDVVQAWNETTAGMSWGEKAIYQLHMKLPTLLANFNISPDGQYISHAEPGDANWVNPQADPDWSYVDQAQRTLDYLDYFKNRLDPIHYKRDTNFYRSFQQRLLELGAQ